MEGLLADELTTGTRDFDEVLSGALAGDGSAFAELWRRHAPTVAGFVRTRSAADPDEVTNDVFATVFGRLDRFTGDERGFRALLLTVARRRVVDDHRRRSRRPATQAWDDRPASVPDRGGVTTDGPEDSVLATRTALDLLSDLSRDQREVLVLRVVADLTCEEIARVIGKSTGAVKALQRRGLEALRVALPGHDQGDER